MPKSTFSEENVMNAIRKLDFQGVVEVMRTAIQQEKRVTAEGAAPIWERPYPQADPTVAKWLTDAEEAAK